MTRRRARTVDPHALTDEEITILSDELLALDARGLDARATAIICAFVRESLRLRNTGRGTVPK